MYNKQKRLSKENPMLPKEFATAPSVYAVGHDYQIIVPVKCETLMWVRVGDQCFYDDSNGILRSHCSTHRMTVPMELLDAEKKYTVCYRVVNERKPYFADVSDVYFYESVFRPLRTEGEIRMYHISDAHNRIKEPVAAGKYFGDQLDLLILNGDLPHHSGNIENFTTIHEIAAQITNGELPVVFARGNHDTRGIYAEELEYHTPTDRGCSYYTVRLGHIWGLVLDCGEDKPDDHEEYGHTICCEDFRRRETAFIKRVIANAKHEYEAEGVDYRLVICHVPFTYTPPAPFDIEIETYREWARLLGAHVHPQMMICGHKHACYITPIGGERDDKGQPCPVIVGAGPTKGPYTATAYTLYKDRCNVKFTDENGEIKGDTDLIFN
jgi:hypothetical protein